MTDRRVPPLVLVLLLHAGLWALLRQVSPWPDRAPSADRPAPLQVRPVAPPERPVPAPARVPRWWTPRAPDAPAATWPEPISADPASQAITRPPEAAAAPEPADAAASAPPLDLRLRRGFAASPGVRQQALDDPRANSARAPTVESRIASALADRPLAEEPMADGRRRVRKGQGCVEVHDARIAAIDPFSESVRPSPKQARPCS